MLPRCIISENRANNVDCSTVNFYVVECEAQRYDSAPTTSTLDLLKFLPRHSQSGSVEQPADTFVGATLADIRASTFYHLTVRYAKQTLPEKMGPSAANVNKGTTVCNCTPILALVASVKASQKTTLNDTGTTVTTHDEKRPSRIRWSLIHIDCALHGRYTYGCHAYSAHEI